MKEYKTLLGNENFIYCRWCSRLKESMSIVFNYYKGEVIYPILDEYRFYESVLNTNYFA